MVLLASGCLTTDAYVTINGDGSGELRLEVFPPVAVSGALDASGVEALARDALEGVDGATFESKERLGHTFYIVNVPFEDVRQLTTNIADGATMAGQRVTPFSQFDLRELPDGGWSLNAVTNPLDLAATFSEGSALAGLQGLAGTEEAGVGLELSVTLPGRLTDSNADSQEDNTARWILNDPAASYDLQMRTESTPLLTQLQWVLLGLVAVFVLGGVLMFVGASGPVKGKSLRRRSRKEHEAFLSAGEVETPSRSKKRKQHAHRRKRMVTDDRTGWENPGPVPTPGDAGFDPPDPGSDPQHHRPLPHIDVQGSPGTTDSDFTDHPSHGETIRPQTVLPPGPKSGRDESADDR